VYMFIINILTYVQHPCRLHILEDALEDAFEQLCSVWANNENLSPRTKHFVNSPYGNTEIYFPTLIVRFG